MRRWTLLGFSVLLMGGLGACSDRDSITVVDPGPERPLGLEGWYYDRAVHLVWELAPGWDGESFRVYGKRRSDPSWFRIAEVTNCSSGSCSYTDVNVTDGVTYEYYVSAVDPSTGVESEGTWVVEVFVPAPTPPPSPATTEALALDGAVYLRWDGSSAEEPDFSHFRVYLVDPAGGSDFLLGETDSRGFLDERTANGNAYTYRVTAVDDQGHESAAGPVATAIPRPDFHGEWLWAYQHRPAVSGFRFQSHEDVDPVVDGGDPSRHFRIEVDADGMWLVPGPGTLLYEDAFATTALRCGPGSDASCVELTFAPAPTSDNYGDWDLEVLPQATYVLEVVDDGELHYGALRVEMIGTDQAGDAIVIFDWAYQLVSGSLALAPPVTAGTEGGLEADTATRDAPAVEVARRPVVR